MRGLPIFAACAATLGLAGCGGESKPPDPTRGLTADQILQRAVEGAIRLDAFRITLDATLQATVAPRGGEPTLVEGILREPVAIRGEGPVDGANASFDLDATLSGLPPIQANVTKAGRTLSVGLLGTDYRVDLPPARIGAVIPARLGGRLMRWVADPVDAGREEIDGVPTVRLRGTIDLDRAVADLAPAIAIARGGQIEPGTLRRLRAQLEAGLSVRDVDVWIAVSDFTARRVQASLRLTGPIDAVPRLRSAATTLDIRLSDLGVRTPIVPPPTTEVLDLERLGGFLGR